MTESRLEHFNERAAIHEFDAGMLRERAERNAWWGVFCRHCINWNREAAECLVHQTVRCDRFQAR